MNKASLSLLAIAGALVMPPTAANAAIISACVNSNSGDMRIVAAGSACGRNAYLLEWEQFAPAPPPAPTLVTRYFVAQPNADGAARAFCPPGWTISGGGGAKADGTVGLSESFPFTLPDGAFGNDQPALGWQVVASDFSPVIAFVVCAKLE